MSTADATSEGVVVHVKGAPEEVLARSATALGDDGEFLLTPAIRREVTGAMDELADRGLRVLAVARRPLSPGTAVPRDRDEAERDLCLLGLVSMLDPPRPEVAAAIRQAHRAGIRIHVVTGDNGVTAAAIAHQVGIGDGTPHIINGPELDALPEAELDRLLGSGQEIFLGLISAVLVMLGFFLTLHRAGWVPGRPTGPGTPLHHAYQQATTVTWLGIVTCQIGTAFAVRTDRASLRTVGLLSNKYLLGAIAVALAFAAVLIYLPAMHGLFGTAALTPAQLATVAPYPFVVWGADELRRLALRRHATSARAATGRPGVRS